MLTQAITHSDDRRSSASRHALRLQLAGFALLIAVGTLACEEEAPPPAAPAVRPVKMVTVGASGPARTTDYSGRITAWQHADMAFEVPGKIIDFPFIEGDHIEKGTIIARLDPRDFNAGLQAAKANLAQAKADLERYEVLFKEGVSAKAELEAKQQRYEVTSAELKSAEKAIEDANLTAPFTGTYAKKLVQDFQNVRAKQPVMILQDDTKLKIIVSVPESDMAGGQRDRIDTAEVTKRIKPKVVLSTRPDQPIPAELYEISTTADPMTRTFDATFVIDNPPDFNVLPGMTAKVTTEMPITHTLGTQIPGNAVGSDSEGQTYVWIVDEAAGTISKRVVEIGDPSGANIGILSGLAPGEVVVTSGVADLREGARVSKYER